jgi:nicotinate-nucleotide pyrophosphorylase (carboxylating)
MFSAAETAACSRLIELALVEDLGRQPDFRGDVTSFYFLPPSLDGNAVIAAREAGVVAGLPAAALVCGAVSEKLHFQPHVEDGASVQAGTHLAAVSGLAAAILIAERTILNFLQHLSGIATLTRRYVSAIAGLSCEIVDTRKTIPGWRSLEKYAVRCGGGQNHRMGLYDMVLIKDNHLAWARKTGMISKTLRRLRKFEEKLSIEVEVETLEQFDEFVSEKPDFLLLDNMTLDQIREAVRRRNAIAPQVKLEASGGITLANVRAVAETGVDRISVGALTHSAPALDIALEYVEELQGAS